MGFHLVKVSNRAKLSEIYHLDPSVDITLGAAAKQMAETGDLERNQALALSRFLEIVGPSKKIQEVTAADIKNVRKVSLKQFGHWQGRRVHNIAGSMAYFLKNGEMKKFSREKLPTLTNGKGEVQMEIGAMKFGEAKLEDIKDLLPLNMMKGRFYELKMKIRSLLPTIGPGNVGTIQAPRTQMDEKEANRTIANVKNMFKALKIPWTLVFNHQKNIFFLVRKEDYARFKKGEK